MRKLGTNGPSVHPLALGCMGMSAMYGPADESESIATIHAALDRGVNLLDTGDFYGIGHNELLIGRALKGKRDRALLSVKFGALRAPGGAWIGVDTRPVAVKNALAHTRRFEPSRHSQFVFRDLAAICEATIRPVAKVRPL